MMVPSGFRHGAVATDTSGRTPPHSPRAHTQETTGSGGSDLTHDLLRPSYLSHRALAAIRSRTVGSVRDRITDEPSARRMLLSFFAGPFRMVTTPTREPLRWYTRGS